MSTSTGEYVQNFTVREDGLKARLKSLNITELPHDLKDWRMWIGDSAVYLNRLKDFTEDQEAKNERTKQNGSKS
jgi:hypothetical protein